MDIDDQLKSALTLQSIGKRQMLSPADNFRRRIEVSLLTLDKKSDWGRC